MSILTKLFPKKKQQREVEQTHVIVEKKSVEAHDILNEIQSKVSTVSIELEEERKRSNRELDDKNQRIKDVAAQIAYITGIS